MTLDEAIKNLEFHIRQGEVGHHKDDIISVKLGIEGLKLWVGWSPHNLPWSLKSLITETEE